MHDKITVYADEQFNQWISDDVNIRSFHTIGDMNGFCREIVIFYDEPEKKDYTPQEYLL